MGSKSNLKGLVLTLLADSIDSTQPDCELQKASKNLKSLPQWQCQRLQEQRPAPERI